jgi:hypothetical protein
MSLRHCQVHGSGAFGPLVLWVKHGSGSSIQLRQQFVHPSLRIRQRLLRRFLAVEGGGDFLADEALDGVLAPDAAGSGGRP